MFRLNKKIVAVLLAIWLPMFSGNALAAAIGMQVGKDCGVHAFQPAAGMQISAGHQHHHPAQQHHASHTAHSAASGCAVCQVGCCGYLASMPVGIPAIGSRALIFEQSEARFKSISIAPLVPPPLARV